MILAKSSNLYCFGTILSSPACQFSVTMVESPSTINGDSKSYSRARLWSCIVYKIIDLEFTGVYGDY